MVSVKLYYRPECPKCDEYVEFLSRLSAEIGFEFEPVLVDTSLEAFYTKDPVSKIYDWEWFEKFGTEDQKELYKKAEPLFSILGSKSITPVLEITWFYGAGERSIVISGFSKEHSKKALSNIIKAIVQLMKLERRASSPIGIKHIKELIR